MTFVIQYLDKIIKRGLHVDGAHVHTGRHNLADRGLHEVEDVQNHLLFFFFQSFGVCFLTVGKVGLYSVTALFGQETELGIVTQPLQEGYKQNMTDFGRNHKRDSDNFIKRNQYHRQGIGFQIAQ